MKSKLIIVSSISLIILVFVSCNKNEEFLSTDEGLKKASVEAQTPDMVPNEMLVRFKAGTVEDKKIKVLNMVGGKVKEKVLTKMMERTGDKEGFLVVNIPGHALEAIARVKDLPEIEYAEPNYIYKHDAISDDFYYTAGSLWGMYGDASPLKTNAYGSQAAEAWAAGNTGSDNVYVGIIDEGYMYTHLDLVANVGVNPGEINGTAGVDDDGNDLIDDIYGWDFANNNNTIYDGTTDDHGTHVAGTIGAEGGNLIGVAGVCWNVKLLNAKFLGTTGGTTTNAIKAVDYFTNLKAKGLNIVATNNSWGGGGYSTDLFNAIDRARNAGILFIAAAGNEKRNIDRKPSYPASYNLDNIISVASITSTGTLSSFSNYGLKSVDLGAPGSAIYSTLPDNKYGSYSGTSMATPHVTGAAALYKAANPNATAAQIKAAILDAAKLTPTASLTGKCVTGGRLNVSGF